jgi:hypothetical protein
MIITDAVSREVQETDDSQSVMPSSQTINNPVVLPAVSEKYIKAWYFSKTREVWSTFQSRQPVLFFVLLVGMIFFVYAGVNYEYHVASFIDSQLSKYGCTRVYSEALRGKDHCNDLDIRDSYFRRINDETRIEHVNCTYAGAYFKYEKSFFDELSAISIYSQVVSVLQPIVLSLLIYGITTLSGNGLLIIRPKLGGGLEVVPWSVDVGWNIPSVEATKQHKKYPLTLDIVLLIIILEFGGIIRLLAYISIPPVYQCTYVDRFGASSLEIAILLIVAVPVIFLIFHHLVTYVKRLQESDELEVLVTDYSKEFARRRYQGNRKRGLPNLVTMILLGVMCLIASAVFLILVVLYTITGRGNEAILFEDKVNLIVRDALRYSFGWFLAWHEEEVLYRDGDYDRYVQTGLDILEAGVI